jgi:hypothetical protein
MITSRRIGWGSAFLQPHLTFRAGQAGLKGWLECGERQILRRSPELSGEPPKEELPVIASHLEHAVRQGRTPRPLPIRCTPVDPVVVHPGHPEGAVRQYSPPIDPTEDPALEATAGIADHLGNIQRSQTGNGIYSRQSRIGTDHGG